MVKSTERLSDERSTEQGHPAVLDKITHVLEAMDQGDSSLSYEACNSDDARLEQQKRDLEITTVNKIYQAKTCAGSMTIGEA